MRCLACHTGAMEEQLVEAWFKRNERWVLVTNIPGMVCDSCGERTYSQATVDRIEQVVGQEAPAELRWVRVFDYATQGHAATESAPYSTTIERTDTVVRASYEAHVVQKGMIVAETIGT